MMLHQCWPLLLLIVILLLLGVCLGLMAYPRLMKRHQRWQHDRTVHRRLSNVKPLRPLRR